MTGKIRVSIVATALDGYKTENKTVLNMFSRVQNRNTGYSENLFSQNSRIDSNTISSIDGATALKLDESFQLDKQEQDNSINYTENQSVNEGLEGTSNENERISNDFSEGISIESASYMESNNNLTESEKSTFSHENNEEEYTQKLFSEENEYQSEENSLEPNEQANNNESEQLFDQDDSEEEDFEIPCIFKKQKF